MNPQEHCKYHSLIPNMPHGLTSTHDLTPTHSLTPSMDHRSTSNIRLTSNIRYRLTQNLQHSLLLKIMLLISLSLTWGLFAQSSQDAQSSQENASSELKGELIPYTFAGETYVPGESSIRGYLVLPESRLPRPGVILIHEWWGLNDDIKRKADEFAEAGYVAFAVDLYNGKATTDPKVARRLANDVRADVSTAFDNLKAAVATLENHPRVNSRRLASVGWCFGGGWSYQMALNNLKVKASVIYYGAFNPADDLSKMRTEIIGHFAENDRGISVDNVREFQVRLKTINGNHEVYIYPNTTHGFAGRPGKNPLYKKEEAELAMQRTLSFLEKVF